MAEWIKEEAGTGASIESGSHRCPIICADFILLATIIHNPLLNKIVLFLYGDSKIRVVIRSIFDVLYVFHNKQNAIIKKISLILLKTNALKLQLKVVILNRQKLINKKDVIPINSQPINKVKKLLLITKKIIEKINQFNSKINSLIRSSNLK